MINLCFDISLPPFEEMRHVVFYDRKLHLNEDVSERIENPFIAWNNYVSGDGSFRDLHKRIPNWGFWKPNHYTTDIKSSWHVICKKKSATGFKLSLHIFKSYVLDGWYMTRVHNSKIGHGIVYWHHCLEQCLLVLWNFRPAKDKNPCFVMGKAIKKAMRRWVCPKLAKDILRNVTAVNLMSSFLALP